MQFRSSQIPTGMSAFCSLLAQNTLDWPPQRVKTGYLTQHSIIYHQNVVRCCSCLHFAYHASVSPQNNRAFVNVLLAASGTAAMLTLRLAAWLREVCQWTRFTASPHRRKTCPRWTWWTCVRGEQRFLSQMRKEEPSLCLKKAVSHYVLSFVGVLLHPDTCCPLQETQWTQPWIVFCCCVHILHVLSCDFHWQQVVHKYVRCYNLFIYLSIFESL